jgi:hypothetical protein
MTRNGRIWAMVLCGLIAGVALAATPAAALTLTWNTCNGGGDGICSPGGLTPSPRSSVNPDTVDEVMTFDAIGDATKKLAAEAFRTTNSLAPYGAIVKRQINIFEGGIGAGPEGFPEHAVDNKFYDELVVFKFGQDTYIPQSYRIGYKHEDADIVTYIGGAGDGGATDILALFLAGGFDWDAFIGAFAGDGAGGAGSLGFVQETFENVPVGVDQAFSFGASGRYLIIAARNETDPPLCSSEKPTSPCDGGEDKFKIQQIVGELPDRVPEPGTLLLVATGLVALAPLARRRRG